MVGVVNMVPDGCGVGGHANEMGVMSIAQTMATETQRKLAYLRQ